MANELQEVLDRRAATAGPLPKADRADDISTYGADYVSFCQKVRRLTDIDLERYKGQQMHRRLDSYRARQGMPDFVALANAVQMDQQKLTALVDFLTINVSEFFRNPEQWGVLREKILPLLLDGAGTNGIRAWSAGSSAGQEAYSLAMTLSDLGARGSAILGTDIDQLSLRKADAGTYTKDEVASIPRLSLARHFVPEGTLFRAGETIRRMTTFRRHNLLTGDNPQGMDLILCRNVLIYFTDKGKEQIIRGFAGSSKPGGFLFTGATEAIFNPAAYGFTQVQPFFYRKGKYETGRRS